MPKNVREMIVMRIQRTLTHLEFGNCVLQDMRTRRITLWFLKADRHDACLMQAANCLLTGMRLVVFAAQTELKEER